MSGYFWKRRFFCPLSKKKPPHVAYSNSFLPVHTKTLRRMELRLQALQGMLCMMYDMMISYSKTSVLSVYTISRHFKNLLSGEYFWKHALSLTVFTGYVRTVAVTDRGEGSRGPGPPLIYRPNWGPKGWKKIGRPSPPLSQGLDDWPPPLSDGLDPPLSWPNRGGGNWSRFQTDTCGLGLRKKLYKKIHKKEIYIRSNQSTLQVSY